VVHADTVQEQYSRLLSSLADGWSVEPPIYARPSWSTRSSATLTYNFVLRRSGDIMLVSVQDNPVVRDLIQKHAWESSWLGGETEISERIAPL
jgi:hypothetical protein